MILSLRITQLTQSVWRTFSGSCLHLVCFVFIFLFLCYWGWSSIPSLRQICSASRMAGTVSLGSTFSVFFFFLGQVKIKARTRGWQHSVSALVSVFVLALWRAQALKWGCQLSSISFGTSLVFEVSSGTSPGVCLLNCVCDPNVGNKYCGAIVWFALRSLLPLHSQGTAESMRPWGTWFVIWCLEHRMRRDMVTVSAGSATKPLWLVVRLEPHCGVQVGFEFMTFLPRLF